MLITPTEIVLLFLIVVSFVNVTVATGPGHSGPESSRAIIGRYETWRLICTALFGLGCIAALVLLELL